MAIRAFMHARVGVLEQALGRLGPWVLELLVEDEPSVLLCICFQVHVHNLFVCIAIRIKYALIYYTCI